MEITQEKNKINVNRENEKWVWEKKSDNWILNSFYLGNKKLFSELEPATLIYYEKDNPIEIKISFDKYIIEDKSLIFQASNQIFDCKLKWIFDNKYPRINFSFKPLKEIKIELLEAPKFIYYPKNLIYSFVGGVRYIKHNKFDIVNRTYKFSYPFSTYYKIKIPPKEVNGNWYRSAIYTKMPVALYSSKKYFFGVIYSPVEQSSLGNEFVHSIRFDGNGLKKSNNLSINYCSHKIFKKRNIWLGMHPKPKNLNIQLKPSEEIYTNLRMIYGEDSWEKAVDIFIKTNLMPKSNEDIPNPNIVAEKIKTAFWRAWESRLKTFLQLPFKRSPEFLFDDLLFSLTSFDAERLSNFYDYYLVSGDADYLSWSKKLRDSLLSRKIIEIKNGKKIWHNGTAFNGVRSEGYTYLWTGYAGYPGGQATIVFRLLEFYLNKLEHENISDLRILNNALEGLDWIIETQKENGAWRSAIKIFREYPARRVDYSKQESIGGTAECIRALLKAFEITGDKKYRNSAKKGLDRINDKNLAVLGYNYLRDAGIFEEEGISAIIAANANIDAYLILQDEKYLNYALIWAKYLLTWHFMWNSKNLNIKYGFDPLSWSITPRVAPYETAMVLSVYSRLYKITQEEIWKQLFINVYKKVVEFQENDGGLSETYYLNYLNGLAEIPISQTFAANELLKSTLEFVNLDKDLRVNISEDKIQVLEGNSYIKSIEKKDQNVKIILKNDNDFESPAINITSDFLKNKSLVMDSNKEIISRNKTKIFGLKIKPKSEIKLESKEIKTKTPKLNMIGVEEYLAIYDNKNQEIELNYNGKKPSLNLKDLNSKFIQIIFDQKDKKSIIKKVPDKGSLQIKLPPKINRVLIKAIDEIKLSNWFSKKYSYRIPIVVYPKIKNEKDTDIIIKAHDLINKSPIRINKSEIIFISNNKEIPFDVIGESDYLDPNNEIIIKIKPNKSVSKINMYIGQKKDVKTVRNLKLIKNDDNANVFIKKGQNWIKTLKINLNNTPSFIFYPNKDNENENIKVDFSFWDAYSKSSKLKQVFKRTLRNYNFRLSLGLENFRDLLYGVQDRERDNKLHLQTLEKVKNKKFYFKVREGSNSDYLKFDYGFESDFHRIMIKGHVLSIDGKLYLIFNPLKIDILNEDLKNCKQPLIPVLSGKFELEEEINKEGYGLKIPKNRKLNWFIFDKNRTTGEVVDRFIHKEGHIGADVSLKSNWVHAGEYCQYSTFVIDYNSGNSDITEYRNFANNLLDSSYEVGNLQTLDPKILEKRIEEEKEPIRTIKVAMIYPGAKHGIYHYVRNLRNNLSKENVKAGGLYFPEEEKVEPIDDKDQQLIPRFSLGGFYFVIPDKKENLKKINEFYKENKFDILHLNWPSTTWDSYALEFAKKKKIPIVVNLHYALSLKDDFYGILSRLMYNISKRYLKNADLIIVTSKAQESFVRNLGYSNVVHIPTGVDIEYFKPHPKKPSKIKTILYVGRISPEKNLEAVIRAFKKCEFSDVRLVIVGKGPLLNKLRSKYVSENILFTGYVPESEKLKYLQNSDLFVSATKMELMSISVLEAMATGLPAITSRIEAFEEFVTRDVGVMIDLDRNFEDNLKSVFEELIQDNKKREMMSKRARQKMINLCSWDKIAHQFRKFYDELI